MIEPVAANLIAAAEALNPSIFTQLWLQREAGLGEEEFEGQSISTQEFAQHRLKKLELLAIPPRIQITFSQEDRETVDKALALLGKIIEKLPHTPFKALGLNFNYIYRQQEGGDFAALDRALFASSPSPILGEFSAPDARFGAYFSKNLGRARLKLDIKPVKTAPPTPTGEILHFNFNFHVDLPTVSREDRVAVAKEALGEWSAYRDAATHILDLVEQSDARG